MASEIPFLCEEIITNILKRLPVKSLIRFQCVSKQWKNLIESQYFISQQLHHSTHQNPSLLLKRKGLWLLDSNKQFHKPESSFLIDSSNDCRLVASCDGLLCFDVDTFSPFTPTLILWNPATREYRELPPIKKDSLIPWRIGMGYSPIVNDYKIVISYNYCCPYAVFLVVVYSLRSGSWKGVDFGIENVGLSRESITVNGVMFWFGFGWRKETETFYNTIVSFDLASEVFTLVPRPDWSASRLRFSVYENKLAVLSLSETENIESLIELWVMEDGTDASWTKKYSSCPIPCFLHLGTIWMNQIACYGAIVCQNEHGEWDHEQIIIVLNISTNELKTFDISKCGRGGSYIFNHAESLVRIGGKKLRTPFV